LPPSSEPVGIERWPCSGFYWISSECNMQVVVMYLSQPPIETSVLLKGCFLRTHILLLSLNPYVSLATGCCARTAGTLKY
jgi:hypothetical protein